MVDVVHDVSGDDLAEVAGLDEFAGPHHAGLVDVVVPGHAHELLRRRRRAHRFDLADRDADRLLDQDVLAGRQRELRVFQV